MKLTRQRCCAVATLMGLITFLGGNAVGQVPTQIETDGSVGAAVTIPDSGGGFYVIDDVLGSRPGGGVNLFHSFTHYDLDAPDTAVYTNTSGLTTQRVINRVTGGSRSHLYGTIDSLIPGASFYFINPDGFVFGPNSTLLVDGSFHVSTADYLELGSELNRFYADLGQSSTLTAAPVSAFGFLGPAAGAPIAGIDIQSSFLRVFEGKNITLIADDITMDDGFIQAPGGRIVLVGVDSEGKVLLDPESITAAPLLVGFDALGDVSLTNLTFIDVDGIFSDAGSVFVRGHDFSMADTSAIFASASSLFGLDGGHVDIEVDGDVNMTNGSFLQMIGYAGGSARIDADNVKLDDASILSVTEGFAVGGAITVDANGELRLTNTSNILSVTQMGPGTGSSIVLSGTDVVIEGGSGVRAWSFDSGPGGTVQITADAVTVSELSDVETGSFDQGLTIFFSLFGLTGDAGDVQIDANTVSVESGGEIKSFTVAGSVAKTGNVTVNAIDSVTVAGSLFGIPGLESEIGIFDLSDQTDSGTVRIAVADGSVTVSDGGVIFGGNFGTTAQGPGVVIDAHSLVIDNGDVTTNTNGPGAAGPLTIDASGSVLVTNQGSLVSFSLGGTGSSGDLEVRTPDFEIRTAQVGSQAFTGGDTGNVTVEVERLRLIDGGTLDNSTFFGAGEGGKLEVIATQSIDLIGHGSPVGVDTPSLIQNINFDGGSTERQIHLVTPSLRIDEGHIRTTTLGTGDAGAINIEVDRLEMSNGALIDSGTSAGSDIFSLPAASGSGGDMNIAASEAVVMDGAVTWINSSTFGSGDAGDIVIDSPDIQMSNSALISGATFSATTGNGGDVILRGTNLNLSGGAFISSSSLVGVDTAGNPATGTGNAGSVVVEMDGAVVLTGSDALGGSGFFSSTATPGDGGNIDVTARDLVMKDGARIAAVSVDTGNAGEITLDLARDLVIRNSAITASADFALGGNIMVNAGRRLRVLASDITTSVASGVGTGGNIVLTAPVIELDGATVTAEAFEGNGGNITITANHFVASPDSVVSAASDLGIDGEVQINSGDIDTVGEVEALDASFLDASKLLRASCAARATETGGSFVVVSRRGLPISPEGLLLAFDAVGEQNIAATDPKTPDVSAGLFQVALRGGHGGAEAFRGGRLEEAERDFSEASESHRAEGNPIAESRALRGLAQTRQAQGRFDASVESLERALELAEDAGDPAGVASALGSLGNVQIALGEIDSAVSLLIRALEQAEQTDNAALDAAILNNLGNALSARGDFEAAVRRYEEAAARAKVASQPLHEAKALSNAARAALDADSLERAAGLLERADERTRGLAATRQKVYVQIHVGLTHMRISQQPSLHRRQNLLAAHAMLTESVTLALALDEPRALSYAYGNLGALYKGERRNAEALYATRRALASAEQADALESAYRWHWQEGQILWKQGHARDAIHAYRRAVLLLEETRQEAVARYDGADVYFRRAVAPVYHDLVDALLASAGNVGDPERATPLLIEARNTMELLKAAELRDYFRDECIAELEEKSRSLDEIAGRAAVVYPILLPDRLELLISLSSGLERRVVAEADAETVRETALRFRRELTDRDSDAHIKTGQQLYDWLVRPYEDRLTALDVDTIVFVPDGMLRTIPMSALHDGEQYLAKRFSLAVTPGLDLIDPKPLEREHPTILLGGLSESVQGYSALAKVPDELFAIQGLYGGEVLLDEDFQTERIKQAVMQRQPAIVHLATHAVFTGDPSTSFLLTYDGRLTMDQMYDVVGQSRFQKQPLELLVLSACETAAGDERAALGLAGVAIRAGARSALGSLWKISDEATYELVVEFYKSLQDPSLSKANALRNAQLALMDQPRFAHPYYWSPFLLINNWL